VPYRDQAHHLYGEIQPHLDDADIAITEVTPNKFVLTRDDLLEWLNKAMVPSGRI
jgi:hypothetical protein